MKAEIVSVGSICIFSKSGNEVCVIARAEPYLGLECWTVERTQGVSAGKQMIVPERALVNELE